MKDKDKKLKDLVTRCRDLLGNNLDSIILYGSAATGEYVEKYSDLNIVLILGTINRIELTKIAPFVERWCQDGNPPPLLMTRNEIQTSKDVFPMEFLDIRDRHEILYGEDPFRGLVVDLRNLRHQCEHELRGKIIRLREQFLLSQRSDARLRELLVHSLSTFVALFRGTMRLLVDDVPMAQRDVIRRISEVVGLDLGVLEKILDLKGGGLEIKGDDLRVLYGDYLEVVGKVAEKVDNHLVKQHEDVGEDER